MEKSGHGDILRDDGRTAVDELLIQPVVGLDARRGLGRGGKDLAKPIAACDEVCELRIEVGDGEGFLDVGVGAVLQPLNLGFEVSLGRQQHHRDVRSVDVGLDAAAQFEAVHPVHHHVAYHQIDPVLGQHEQRLLTARHGDAEIAFTQYPGEEIQYFGIVVDQHDGISPHRGPVFLDRLRIGVGRVLRREIVDDKFMEPALRPGVGHRHLAHGQFHPEGGARKPAVPVGDGDGSPEQLDQLPGHVQPDAAALCPERSEAT